MITRRLLAAPALCALGAAALAGQATAATKTVYAGPNAKTDSALAVNRFYNDQVSIHVGDTVAWQYRGFHNITIPRKGTKPVPAIGPDPSGAKYTGVNDPAGSPFWFNGQPVIAFGAAAAIPSGGKVYDGTKDVGSGLPTGSGPPNPFKVKFTRAGTYTYYCTLHNGMKGQVKVLARKAKIARAAASETSKAARQLKADLATAKKLATLKPAAGTISGGSDKGFVNWLRFFPSTTTVKAGATVTFQVPGAQEPHTLSFANEALVREITNQQGLALDGRAVFPSDPPGALPDFDGANHGGFYSTGALGLPGTPKKVSFRAVTAGTYTFFCLIHPEMKGTLKVV